MNIWISTQMSSVLVNHKQAVRAVTLKLTEGPWWLLKDKVACQSCRLRSWDQCIFDSTALN